jgi:hypothetical protein
VYRLSFQLYSLNKLWLVNDIYAINSSIMKPSKTTNVFFDRDVLEIIKITVIIKTTFLLFILFIHSLFPYNKIGQQVNYYYKTSTYKLGELHSAWDGQWFTYLADQGYSSEDKLNPGPAKYAYFPLYPLFLKIVSLNNFSNIAPASIITNLILQVGISIYLFKLVKLDYSITISKYTVIFFLITPMAVFFSATYADSLFLFLSLTTFYYLRSNLYGISILTALLAGLTRTQGVFLMFPLIVEGINKINARYSRIFRIELPIFTKTTAVIIAPLIGVLIYILYVYSLTGSLTTIFDATKYFGRMSPNLLNPFFLVYKQVSSFSTLPLHSFNASKIDAVYIFFYLILLIPMYKKLRFSYFIYGFIIVIAGLVLGTSAAIPKYYTASFPHLLYIAILSSSHPSIKWGLLTLSSMLMTIFSLMFVNWYWVS